MAAPRLRMVVVPDAKRERWAAWGGVVAVVCFVVAGFVGQDASPGTRAQLNPAKVAKVYIDNANGIRAAPFIFGVGVIFLLWWFGTLWGMMRRAEGGHARLAVTAGLALGLAGGLELLHETMKSAIAWQPLALGSSIVTIAAMSTAVSSAAILALAGHLGAVSALAIRTRFLPGWVTWGGVLVGVLCLIAALDVSTFNGIQGVGAIADGLWAVWILGVSWTMWRAPAHTTAPSRRD